jgi:hypothetical protein
VLKAEVCVRNTFCYKLSSSLFTPSLTLSCVQVPLIGYIELQEKRSLGKVNIYSKLDVLRCILGAQSAQCCGIVGEHGEMWASPIASPEIQLPPAPRKKRHDDITNSKLIEIKGIFFAIGITSFSYRPEALVEARRSWFLPDGRKLRHQMTQLKNLEIR